MCHSYGWTTSTWWTLPGEAFQLNCLSQNRKELFKLFTFFIVTKYVLLSELERDGCCLRDDGYGMVTYFSHFYECRTFSAQFRTCPSFWYKMPNLKLGDTLCSSNAVMSSGAWGMREKLSEDLSKISGHSFLLIGHFIEHYLEEADHFKLWDSHSVTEHLERKFVIL